MAERSAMPDKIGRDNGLVDPQLWHACAGSQIQIPPVGSSVIYFPQGHGEHASSPPDFPKGFSSSTIPCRVVSVKFLADSQTDEVYARISLHPECTNPSLNPRFDPPSPPRAFNASKMASFAKTLTQSDANNGGGFSVPRYCAETIFPRLDYNRNPPLQIILARDVHGNEWQFRHIYRGTPRRHLLTTGWSSFVNQKKLVAGDVIVFLRDTNGVLCVGVRRSSKTMGARETSIPWHHVSNADGTSAERPSNWDANSIQGSGRFLDNGNNLSSLSRLRPDIALHKHGFARNRARVSSKSVLEAATLAAAGKPFEVIFYPMATIAEFCVNAQSVRASLQQNWAAGMRFKMAMETEDASRISWFMGTVSRVQEADPILWPNSPWKMLQVAWDEPDLLQGNMRVSPWQVEAVPRIQLPPLSLPKKKARFSQLQDFVLDGPDHLGMAYSTFHGEMTGLVNPGHRHFDSIPAGMQGARHDQNYGPSFQTPKFPSTNFLRNNTFQRQEFPIMGEVLASAGSNISVQEFYQHGCENVQISPPNPCGKNSQSQLTSIFGNDNEGTSGRKTTFMLFGKIIHTSQSFNQQQPQVSTDSSRHDEISDSFNSEVCDDAFRLFADQGILSHPLKMAPSLLEHFTDSGTNKAWTLKRPSQQAEQIDRTTSDNNSYHCKVFGENDDVGRTVDLSMFSSYEQLYEALENMFGVQKSDFRDRVVCVDSMGSSRPVGDEPYWDFIQRVERLKILTESSSENTTK